MQTEKTEIQVRRSWKVKKDLLTASKKAEKRKDVESKLDELALQKELASYELH